MFPDGFVWLDFIQITWNKGHAVSYLLDAWGLSGSPSCFPIYLGDDRTDEDAFVKLRELYGHSGCFPILVSNRAKETCATHSLSDPSEVLQFLNKLAQWA